MSGKWTKRGIECEHEPSHLVADKDGVVVCNKRKPREEIPVGEMIRTKDDVSVGWSERGPVGEELLGKLYATALPLGPVTISISFAKDDQELRDIGHQLLLANGRIKKAKADANAVLVKLQERFLKVIYENGLAAPTLEALHDPRYGCGLHPEARFLWRPFESLKVIKMFRRDCVACLNPELARVIACEPKRIPEIAYKCFTCGFVLGGAEVQNDSPPVYKKWYCTLCGTKIGEATLNK